MIAIATLLLGIHDATACSCVFDLRRTLAPAPGSVATDVRLAVVFDGPHLDEVIADAAQGGYRLVGPDGVVAADLALGPSGHAVHLVPEEPLQPGGTYVLEERVPRLPAGVAPPDRLGSPWRDEADRLLTDEAVYTLILSGRRDQDPVTLDHSWVAVGRYRARAGRSPIPEAPRGLRASFHYRIGGGDCGPGTGIVLEADPAPDVAFYRIEQRGRGPVAVDTILDRQGEPRGRWWVSDLHCSSPTVPQIRDGRYTVRLVAVGASGAEAASEWVDAIASSARTLRSAPGPAVQAIVGGPDAVWLATAVGVVRARADRIEARYTTRDGLPDDGVLSLAAHGDSLWGDHPARSGAPAGRPVRAGVRHPRRPPSRRSPAAVGRSDAAGSIDLGRG